MFLQHRSGPRPLLGNKVHISSDSLGGLLSQLKKNCSLDDEYFNLFTVTAISTQKGDPKYVFNHDDSGI